MNRKQGWNPYLPLDTYIPDGEPHVFGDRIYIYGSHDKEGGEYFCLLDYEAWSAPINDLTDWRCEGTIYRAEQCKHYCKERQDLYAPDVVQGKDGRYYLTYGWGLGMDVHAGLSKYVMPKVMAGIFNKPVEEIKSEEPQTILGANIVELADDMVTVKSEPKRILDALVNAPKDSKLAEHSFYEGASLRKFGDYYYFIYSTHKNHELCYATSKYPDHGYEYRGVIISNGDIGYRGRAEKERLAATGTNHGSIEYINGKYYIFYHRLTHNTAFSRQGCAEEITIGPDGTIEQVEMTSCGLNGGPLMAQGEYPAPICCNLTNGKMPHLSNAKKNRYAPNINHEGNERFIKDLKDKTLIGYKYFEFHGETGLKIVKRGASGIFRVMTEPGKIVAEIYVDDSGRWQESEKVTFHAEGVKPLYLEYQGRGKVDFLKFELF